MPATFQDPSIFASAPTTLQALGNYLITYAGNVHSEAYWTTNSGSDVPYRKRQALAHSLLLGAQNYTKSFALLLGTLTDMELTQYATQQAGYPNLYDWLVNDSVLDLQFRWSGVGNPANVGPQAGTSIFDNLAGISQQDMI